jgi:hypothetical protein
MMPSYTLSTPAIFGKHLPYPHTAHLIFQFLDITPITGNGSDYEGLNLLINKRDASPHVQQTVPTDRQLTVILFLSRPPQGQYKIPDIVHINP